jgi:hypothetical protein
MISNRLNEVEARSETSSGEQARQPGEVEGLNSATVIPLRFSEYYSQTAAMIL